MNNPYVYKKPVNRSSYDRFKRYLKVILVLLVITAIIVGFILSGLRNTQKNKPSISDITNTVISDNKTTFTSPYFKFQDSGKWVLDAKSSTADKFSYIKFRGQVIEGTMVVYINQVPIPLYLAASRVLPIRIVNGNSFQVTGVSDPCYNQYANGQPHIVKNVIINGAGMLCDPDTASYSVIISQVEGDYRLHLRRADNSLAQYVIIYTNQNLDPTPDTLSNVANSFQAI